MACEKDYVVEDSAADKFETYCSLECETVFTAALLETAESSKIKGLVDSEGNSILGGAYQQAIDRTIRQAASSIGIKFPPKE